MMETLLTWIKSLPYFLSVTLDILIIMIITMTSLTLLAGMWIGFCIAKRRMNHIAEIQFFPPKIIFKETDNINVPFINKKTK